jgi:cyclic pyranopterin phosphate synthase
MRAYKGQIEPLKEAIIAAIPKKPEKHHFDLEAEPQILRFMNTTGG